MIQSREKMIFLETILFIFTAFVVNSSRGDFYYNRKGICLKTETYDYTFYVSETVEVPKKKKNFCWDIRRGFSCWHTTYKLEQRKVPKTVERTKTVKTCCKGYLEDPTALRFTCEPQCLKGCGLYGVCSDPDICTCFPGYRGPMCEEECPRGFWGKNCIEECECVNGECDATNGICSCESGWRGDRCETPCPFYGVDCNCRGELCDNLPTPTKEQETSTTELTTTESETEESYLGMETTSTESIQTTTPETTSSTETTTLEQIETTTEAFVTETTPTEGTTETSTEEASTVQEEILERKTNSFEMHGKTGLYGNKSEEVNSNKLPEEPQVSSTTIKVSEEKDRGGMENFGLDHEWGEPADNGRRESSRLIYFVPSLTVLSGVSVFIFLIAARWLIVRHRRKVRKITFEMDEKIFHPDGQRKFRIESIFLVNDCAEIPVYVSGPHLENKTPVLQTFKPLPDPPKKGSDTN